MDAENSEMHLKEQLLLLREDGRIKEANLDYVTSFISGGLNEMAIYISRAEIFDKTEIESSVRMMLGGIRTDG